MNAIILVPKEPVRIGKKDLRQNIGFAEIGSLFLEAYGKHKQVRGAKIIYITDPSFPYKMLEEHVLQLERITNSLNYMFQNLKMDCAVCNLKDICDEVEGLRELHQMGDDSRLYRR